MNVPFTLKDSSLDELFLKGPAERGMVQLQGHRSVGGMRAAIYNAMPLEGVLVLAGMLLAARNLPPAIDFVRGLKTSPEFEEQVEDGKKQFAGSELPGHTLGIIGLGKIGSLVADAAIRLGMNVLGYDPHITVDAAWSLPSQVRKAGAVDEVLKQSHFVSLHVPLGEKTRHMIHVMNIEHFGPGAVVLNLLRDGVVADDAVVEGLNS